MGYEIEAQTTMQNGMKARAKDTEDAARQSRNQSQTGRNAETQRNAEKMNSLQPSANLCTFALNLRCGHCALDH